MVLQEDIAKLLRFETSSLDPGKKSSISEYTERMEAGSRTIYYLSAPKYVFDVFFMSFIAG